MPATLAEARRAAPAAGPEPVITPAANTVEGHLPITDVAGLAQALDQGDVPTLLMVYTQISGDESLLEQFRPHIRPLMEGGAAGVPDELRAHLREKLFSLLTRPDVPREAVDPCRMRRMMNVYVGEDVADEFVPLLIEQAGFSAEGQAGTVAPPAGFKVLVIGAGMSGIALGAKLAQAGYDFEVIEKHDEVGGTWYGTTYPGLAVDTPSHFYSFSFELNADWSHWFSRGYQNQAYLRHCGIKYGVRDRTTFRSEVTRAVWDDKAAMWDVTVRSLDTGHEEQRRVNVLISALGFNNRPQTIAIPGAADFRGVSMHSSEWDHAAALDGKRIGVIGTGASSMQLSPQLAKIASQLTVFQRSRHWVNPIAILNQQVPEAVRWAMRHIPHYGQWWRLFTYWNASDGLYGNVVVDPDWHMPDVSTSARNEAMRQYLLAYLDEKLGHRPDLKDKVTPDYPPGAKRLCMDAGWFDMLLQDNVELETSGIERIVENGIVTKDGRLIELDVIVFATGYILAEMMAPIHIEGRDGVTIRDLWGWDDPRAHRGATVPGFPNFFMISGPNSVPQHGAGINILSETQTNFILGCLDLLHEQGGKAIEPTAQAFEAWNEKLDAQLPHMIWGHHRVKSYYQNSAGRLWLSCPFRIVDSWHATRQPIATEFHLHL